MIIIGTRTTHHLLNALQVSVYNPKISYFSDGELHIKVDPHLPDNTIWVLASTQAPAEHILELLFLLDALVGIGIEKINLFITYFGYTRQAVAKPGEPHSAQLICKWLQTFPLNKVYIMHPHATNILESFMPFTPLMPTDFFCTVAQEYDSVAAPDKGAWEVAHKVATSCKKEFIVMEKMREDQGHITITSVQGDIQGKKILLVDDMISTGQTIIKAAEQLLAQGAKSVSAAATHGIFSYDALERINESVLQKVHVTNTLDVMTTKKIQVHDISSYIMSAIKKP